MLPKPPRIVGATLHEIGDITMHPSLQRPAMSGVMRAHLEDDLLVASFRERINDVVPISRSGHSRVGLHLERIIGETPEISRNNELTLPITLSSLRGAKSDELLSTLKHEASDGDFDIGRAMVVDPFAALGKEQVEEARDQGMICLPEHAETGEDGVVHIPLDQLAYLISEPNLNFRMNEILRYGKHTLNGVQAEQSLDLEKPLNSGEFFVGSIRIALGRYMAVLDERTNQPGVFHLAARVLDGVRTTGLHIPRQVELFNPSDQPVPLRDLKVGVRLYPIPENKANHINGSGIISPDRVTKGVHFRHVAEVDKQPERFFEIMDGISPSYKEDGIYAKVLAPGRMAHIDWQPHPDFQDLNALEVTKRLIAGDPEHALKGLKIDGEMRWLTRRLSLVGGDQSKGKMFVSHAFPNPETIHTLFNEGVAVFAAHDLKFEDTGPSEGANQINSMNFHAVNYAQFRSLERRGVQFYMLMHELEDDRTPEGRIPAHIREFYRGFWIRPEFKEAIDKVDTIIALYGSHVDGLDERLREPLSAFMKRIKARFGENAGITHGKGPGIMQIADDVAAEEEIMRFGIGIDLEAKDRQRPNFAPPAMADFFDPARLPRQQVMDDLATFKIFNVGGAGTMEEAAVTLCSQKLHKNLITPIIFVDPFGLNQGEHLWRDLEKQVKVLTQKHHISGVEPEKPLLRSYASKFCHFVGSYEEAADIIERFADNPIQYYENIGLTSGAVEVSLDNAIGNQKRTGFPLPSWYDSEKIRARFSEK